MQTELNVEERVQQILQELEPLRKEIVASKIKGWAAIIIGLLIFMILANSMNLILAAIVFVIFTIYGITHLNRVSSEIDEYRALYKKDVTQLLLASVDLNLTLQANKGISISEFIDSNLFSTRPDRYNTEDLISGNSGKTAFYYAEVHAEYKTEIPTKHGRKEIWNDIIKGMVFVADFNKNFNGITVVRPKDLSSSFGAWFSKNVFSFGNKELVELENPDFSERFVAYSTDQVEARYILTPAFMERVLELDQRTGQTVSLSFVNSKMYIGIPLDHNYFEPPVFRTLLIPDHVDNDLMILKFMYQIVSDLDLNTRIWTKS